jgi:mRNA-degrading endonuclease toxin of MazEF toxin-antitoxin module
MATTGRERAGPETYPRRGEIYLTALGHEIRKTRPALVIQNDVTNRYAMTTVVAAITSRVSTPPYPNGVVVEPPGTGRRPSPQSAWTRFARWSGSASSSVLEESTGRNEASR